ncbi:MAG: MFS transporter [Burkholderiaceae bacterium]|nr:MAG: MFS transporter [Burkholderiaceae bacterium]
MQGCSDKALKVKNINSMGDGEVVRHEADVTGVADGLTGSPAENQPVRRVLLFTIIAMALMMMSIDLTIVATALRALQDGLDTSINWAGWTITAYSLGFVVMLPISGKLSERFGRRRVFIGSVLAFTMASLLCGLAENIFVLVALRALQAAGGAGFTPSATGIVVDYFGDARDRAVSLFGSIFPIGATIGPIFGGLLVSYWSWRSVFFVNVPIGLAVLVLAFRYIPHDRPRAKQRQPGMDAAGMALLGVGLLAGMLAVSYLGEANAHVGSPGFALPLAIAIIALSVFVRHINRVAHPFIDPGLIYGPGFGTVNLITAVFGGVTSGAVALIPLYAANRYGIDALGSGTLLVAQGTAAILLSVVAAMLLRRTGYRLPLYVGSFTIVSGLLLLALSPIGHISPWAWLAGSAFLVGAGFGAINPASRNAGLQLAPERSSTLAALRSASMQIGSITAVSIVTASLASARNPGSFQAWTFAVAALLLIVFLPLIARVPEHRGSW